MNKYNIPKYINGEKIKIFRKKYHLSKDNMANILNISVRTLEGYETKKENIKGPISLLLKILDLNPEIIENLSFPEQKYPLRLLYMSDDFVNTLIDVDKMNQKVEIVNYTNNLMDRAFGIKETVTYKDFEYFLESRCFPKERDKMKMQLELLNLPFYDPLMIIEKTEGRMAEDNYYIKIIRKNRK